METKNMIVIVSLPKAVAAILLVNKRRFLLKTLNECKKIAGWRTATREIGCRQECEFNYDRRVPGDRAAYR